MYGSTRRTGNDVDLWIVDPNEPKSDKLLVQLEGGGWAPLDFSPDDGKLLAINRLSANESYLWLVDVASGKKTLLTPKRGSETVVYEGGQFSRDGNRIFTSTDRDSEFHRLASIDLSDQKAHLLNRHSPWDVSQFELSWDGATIAFVTNEDGRDVLHLLDTATGKERAKPEIPIGIIGGLHWHKNNRDLGFNFLDSRRGADAYSLDVHHGKARALDVQRNGRHQHRQFLRARAHTVEVVRRPHDFRLAHEAARQSSRASGQSSFKFTAVPKARLAPGLARAIATL